ncbi:uncharacterized [Tachysurus ichikawai]
MRFKYAKRALIKALKDPRPHLHQLVSILGLAHDPTVSHPYPVALCWTAVLRSPPNSMQLNCWDSRSQPRAHNQCSARAVTESSRAQRRPTSASSPPSLRTAIILASGFSTTANGKLDFSTVLMAE